MIESTGGKHYKNRNILGWGSALQRFPSEQAGIQYVSSRLHTSPLYTRKSLGQMLLTYNSERRNYVTLVTGIMHQLTAIQSELETQQARVAAAEQPSSTARAVRGAAGQYRSNARSPPHSVGCFRRQQTAVAINYALGRWPALVPYCDDGLLEIDNNAAERALRAVAKGSS